MSHGGHVFVAQYYGNGLIGNCSETSHHALFDMPSSTKFSEIFWRFCCRINIVVGKTAREVGIENIYERPER